MILKSYFFPPRTSFLYPSLCHSLSLSAHQGRVTGGMHGYGAKLTNIFSESFKLELFDALSNTTYRQQWSDHMKTVSPPELSTGEGPPLLSHSDSYTKVTFSPDLKLFNTTLKRSTNASLADINDLLQLLYRRALDLSGVGLFGQPAGKSKHNAIKVTFNGEVVPIASSSDYLQLFCDAETHPDEAAVSEKKSSTPAMLKINDQWEIGVIPSPTGAFEQMSFVNSVWTTRGGTHVNHITSQCVKHIQEVLMNLSDDANPITPNKIKNHLMIFVNCLIENPSFDSQGKESLTTKLSQFSAQSEISVKFLKKIFGPRSDLIRAISESNPTVITMAKPTKGKYGNSIFVEGLEDAHHAGGGHQRSDCTLIITEGESAKALAIAGLSPSLLSAANLFSLTLSRIGSRWERSLWCSLSTGEAHQCSQPQD
jgi:DNA topoisomerase II